MYWTQGLFYTISNIPVTEEEQNLDYGFWRTRTYINNDNDMIWGGYYVNEEGERLDYVPKIKSLYGITTMTGVASDIKKELIINPNLLKFEDEQEIDL
jgi:hypothetical protein